jgi:hypothetical protein
MRKARRHPNGSEHRPETNQLPSRRRHAESRHVDCLRIDHTLTQDATRTLAMLTLEAMALTRVKTEVSVQYVDHNLLRRVGCTGTHLLELEKNNVARASVHGAPGLAAP